MISGSWRELSMLQGSEFEAARSACVGWTCPRMCCRAPNVVRLTRFDRHRRPRNGGLSVPLNRRNIYRRDANTCQYCGKRFPTSGLSLDHAGPVARAAVVT